MKEEKVIQNERLLSELGVCESKNYYQKWGALEDAARELEKEIFGLICKIDGVISTMNMYNFDEHYQIEKLTELKNSLKSIIIKVNEEEQIIILPDYFKADLDLERLSVEGFNAMDTVYVLNNFKHGLIYQQRNTILAYRLISNLLKAIKAYREAFLEYVQK